MIKSSIFLALKKIGVCSLMESIEYAVFLLEAVYCAYRAIDGMSASTHSLPLSMLARYLTLELNCKAILSGIQPRSNDVGGSVSQEVLQAVDEVMQGLVETIAAIQWPQ